MISDKEAMKIARDYMKNNTDELPCRFLSINGADSRVLDAFIKLGWHVKFVTTAVTPSITQHCYHLERDITHEG